MIEHDADARPRGRVASRPGLMGAVAGLVGIACCVYPVVLVLLGLSTAAAAVDLGNRLFAEWGWAFRLAGLSLIAAAVLIQRRRARACAPHERPRLLRSGLIMLGVAVGTYVVLYATTAWLGDTAA
jgi:hypothetical protein